MRMHTSVLPDGAVLVADQQTKGKGGGRHVAQTMQHLRDIWKFNYAAMIAALNGAALLHPNATARR
jgi:hypothetical protein